MIKNKKYSYFIGQNQSFKNRPASEFNNSIIIGANFYQENAPKSDIFPDGMTGVVFKRCNLQNVNIPVGNTVENDCDIRQILIQNDGRDWIVDDNLNPIEPIDKERLLKEGLSIDPADIPAEFIRIEQISKEEWDKTYGQRKIPENSWYTDIPTIIETKIKRVKNLRGKVSIKEYYIISGKAYKYKTDRLKISNIQKIK